MQLATSSQATFESNSLSKPFGARIEEEIKRQNTFTGDLKIVCRNGLPSSAADLWKVGADVCSRPVLALKASTFKGFEEVLRPFRVEPASV